MASDKRRAKRDKHDSVMEILGADGNLRCTGRLSDFSETGAAFFSEEKFSLGEKIKARLRLLHKGVLHVDGEIVWERGHGAGRLYGVKFKSVENVYPTGERSPWR